MIIWFGTRLYGKVDEVRGLFFVATKFSHLMFFPIIPMGSYLVFMGSDGGDEGIRIRFSFKSCLWAWLRFVLLGLGILAATMGVMLVSDPKIAHPPGQSLPIFIGVGMLVVFAASKWYGPMRYAKYERARALAEEAQLPREARLAIDVAYGKLTPQQANAAATARQSRI